MMKKIIFMFIFTLFLTSCSKYEELNNLSIISNITISYKNNNYIVTMQEIIPRKGDNKVDYDYKYRTSSSNNLSKAFSKIINYSPKKIYLKKVQNIIIDYKNRDKIIREFLKYDSSNKSISKDSSIVITKSSLEKIIKINSDYKYIDSILKKKKKTLYQSRKLYKKKERLKFPLLKIENKELVFKKYVYLHE